MGNPDSQQLMQRVQQGDSAAFESLYQLTAPTVERFVRRRLPRGAQHEADDIVQEVFLHAYRSAANFRCTSTAEGWLCGIARHILMRHLRTRSHLARDLIPLDNLPANARSSSASDPSPLIQDFRKLTSKLPPAQRQAFELVHLAGLSRPVAAQCLQCTLPQLRDR